jgi:hypothetical protein
MIMTDQILKGGFNDRDASGVNAFRDANAATSQKGIWGNQRAGHQQRRRWERGRRRTRQDQISLGLKNRR